MTTPQPPWPAQRPAEPLSNENSRWDSRSRAPWSGQVPPSAPGTNGLAIASLVLGVLWLYWIGSLLAVVFGHIALRQVRRSNGWQQGRGLAIAGAVLGWVGIAVLGVIIVVGVVVADDFDSTRGAAAQTGGVAADSIPPGEASITGTLSYDGASGERIPVSGAEVTVSQPDGRQIDTAASAPDGSYVLRVPGAGEYNVSLAVDTLPEGVTSRTDHFSIRIQEGRDSIRTLFVLTAE